MCFPGDVLRAIKRRETCRPSVISLTGERLSCDISDNIVTKPLLRHRVEQTGVSVILRRYGAAGRERLERLFFERRISRLALWWPVALIVVADVIYQICAKKLSSAASPLAALGATYLVSALACVLLFEALSPAGDLMAALAAVPFPAAIAGVSIAGLEVGTIYMYRVGWPMNVGFIVYTGIIVVLLLFIGSCIAHGTDGAYEARRGRTHLFGYVLYCKVRRKYMFSTWWPLLLVVASSVGYQVGLEEVSDIGDPMASLTVTYLAASVVSFVIYFFQSFGKESFSARRTFRECFCHRAGTRDRWHRGGDALHVPGRLGGECGFRRGEQSHRSGADADRISAV